MITVSTEAYISKKNPVILLPNVPEGNYDVVIILQPKAATGKSKPKQPRKSGFVKTPIVMTEDFNAPVEDFKEYM